MTLLASIIQGLTGFGFALVSGSIMIIFLSPKIAVPIIILCASLNNILILTKTKEWIDLKRILPLILTGIIGVPFGTYLLVILRDNISKMFIGSVITIFAVFFLIGFKRKIIHEKLAFIPVGFISGLLSGSTSMGGPPVILFFANQGINKNVFRANIVAYFMILSLITIFNFTLENLITPVVIGYVLSFLPATFLGVIIGIRVSYRIEEKLFQNIALSIVIIAGIISIISGIGIL